MAWSFVLDDNAGGIAELVNATSRKLTTRLLAPGEASFKIDGAAFETALIDELITDLIVSRDGTPLFRGRIISSTDNIDANQHTVDVTAVDYRGLLQHRTLWPTSTAVATGYSAVDQADIAWDLIADSQALTGGDWGITRASATTTGVVRTMAVGFYQAGKNLEQAITELAQLASGFDWEINPDREFVLYFPSRGSTLTDWVISYDASGGNVSSLTRTLDPVDYANAVRVSGATGTTPATQQAADLATRPEGRWEHQDGTDFANDTAVLNRATRELSDASTLRPSYTATLAASSGWAPELFYLGDICPIRIKRGRLDVDSTARGVEFAFEIDDNGVEKVGITFDRPPVKGRVLRTLRNVAGRVERLENR